MSEEPYSRGSRAVIASIIGWLESVDIPPTQRPHPENGVGVHSTEPNDGVPGQKTQETYWSSFVQESKSQ